jgi:hypothetical protein
MVMLLAIAQYTGSEGVTAAVPEADEMGSTIRDVIPMGSADEILLDSWIFPFASRDVVATPKAGTAEATSSEITPSSMPQPPIQAINTLNEKIHMALNKRQIPRAYSYAVELAHILGGSMGLEEVDLPVEQLATWWAIRQWSIETIAEVQRLHRLITDVSGPTLREGTDLYHVVSSDMRLLQATASPDTTPDRRPAKPATAVSVARTPRKHMPASPRVAPTRVPPTLLRPMRSPLIPRSVLAHAEVTLPDTTDIDVTDVPEIFRLIHRGHTPTLRNMRTLSALHELAMYMTSTPIWSQVVTYRMCADREATIPNQGLVLSKIQEQWDLLQSFTTDLVDRYPNLEDIIRGAIRAKDRSYRAYLAHVRAYVQRTPMTQFVAVDRGQTSGSSRNTCMFNSLFAQEVAAGNIRSTKEGAVQAGLAYLRFLTDYYVRYSETADDPLMNPDGIAAHLWRLLHDRGADQEYGPGVEFAAGGYVPGQLSDCSAAEAQCHALGLNYMVIPKQKTGQGNMLEAYFGTAYLGSEHYPIVLVSCSMFHAQGMERMVPRPQIARPTGIKGPTKL